MNIKLSELIKQVALYLKKNKLFITTAESCTGGLLAQTLTSIPGSSEYFERGFITYSNASKQEVLGVNYKTLKKFGAVSIQTAAEMAQGALAKSHSQLAIAITGIAGPDGGTKDKPVGTICIAITQTGFAATTFKTNFSGSRSTIREQAIRFSLIELLQRLTNIT